MLSLHYHEQHTICDYHPYTDTFGQKSESMAKLGPDCPEHRHQPGYGAQRAFGFAQIGMGR